MKFLRSLSILSWNNIINEIKRKNTESSLLSINTTQIIKFVDLIFSNVNN